MRITLALRHFSAPGDRLAAPLGRSAFEILQLNAIVADQREFAVIQKHDFPRIGKQWRNVGRDEVFARSEAQHERRALPGGDDLVAIDGRYHDDAEYAFNVAQCPADRLFQIAVEVTLDQMRQHFGIGGSRESMTRLGELGFQCEVVFNDPIVRNEEAARAIAVRMRIVFARTSVSRPTSVADSILQSTVALTALRQFFFQRSNTPDGTHE